MTSEAKIAVYICAGCELGQRLDTEQLARIAMQEDKVSFAKQHSLLCGQEGVQMITTDLQSSGTTHIVIAACSQRSKTEAFHFEGVAITRTNLREGVIWVQPDIKSAQPNTQEMAEDYIRMGCAEARFITLPQSSGKQGINRHIMIVGGGISGMTAALEAAKAGYHISLIEKTVKLGGIAGQLYKRFPSRSPYTMPEQTGIEQMRQLLAENDKITTYLNTSVAKTSGAPGRFEVELSGENENSQLIYVGSIVQTSGFKPYDARQLSEFSYAKSENIVTQLELESLAIEANGDAIKRPSDGKSISRVIFVQCAGQRSEQPGHLSYCSGHCCNTSIKQAMYFKERNRSVETTILYTDLRTPGVAGENFYRAGQEQQVIFIRGIVHEVTPEGWVRYHNLTLNQELKIQADLVVLATGMEANSGINQLAIQAQASQIAEQQSCADRSMQEPLQNTRTIAAESILNLDYYQGRDLPQLSHSFADSHFICFPYETRRSGIYAAGPVRRPMDCLQSQEDATGAAMKAIQAIENASQGKASHPRVGDLSYPSFRKDNCTQCKRCSVECPFSAIEEDERGYPQYNESRCRRCGTCMGACPVRVISFSNYSIESIGQQISAVNIPDEDEEKPRILVLACENDAYPALDMAAQNRFQYSAFARIIPVRCLGSVNAIWINDALNSGYDGVVLMGCQKGKDYQCHFVKGSEMAYNRMKKITDTLQTLDLEAERVAFHEVAITDIRRAPNLINKMADTIHQIGMNPFKY